MKYKPLLLILILLALTYLNSATWRPGEMKVKLDNVPPESIQEIAELGIEIDHIQFPAMYLYVTPQELKILRQSGYQPEIIIPDMAAYSRQLLNSPALIGYYDYYSALELVDQLTATYPGIIKKVIYGYSVQNRQLYAVKISDNVEVDENEPEIGFDGCHHGDEILSAEILIRLAKELCENYQRNDKITKLVNQREIWIFPFANPDGRQVLTRRNANYVDLNRDWGYMWDAWGNSTSPYSQPETRAVFKWMQERQFVIIQSVHAGMEMISYPWSYRPNTSPDHRIIDFLAAGYADESKYSGLKFGNGFKRLYPINGSAKDSYYGIYGAMGWTMEVSENKAPPSSDIEFYYKRNRSAMLYLVEMANQGIRGKITDSQTGKPVKATLWIKDQNTEYWPVYNNPQTADFHRLLLPGNYTIKVTANGYETAAVKNIVVSDTGATAINFQMRRELGTFAHQVVACRIPGNNFSDDGLTYRALSIPDRRAYSLGRNGWITLDMGQSIFDLTGNDLRIFEGSNAKEGYVVKVAQAVFDEWHLLGSGKGTAEFDLSAIELKEIRYVRIEDDGDGFTGTSNAGFDLDAVEANLIPADGPYLMATKSWIVDTLSNFNGVFEASETVGLNLQIENLGTTSVGNTRVAISSKNPGISILQDSAFVEKIAAGAAVNTPRFVLKANACIIKNTSVLLDVDIFTEDGNHWQHPFKLEVRSGASIVASRVDLKFENNFVNNKNKQSLAIYNHGQDTLKVFRFKTTTAAFQVAVNQLVVAPNQQKFIDVYFLPSEPIQYSDTLAILTNDPRNPEYQIQLSGAGVLTPNFSTMQDSISIVLQSTDSIEIQLPIKNNGAGELEYTAHLSNERAVEKKENQTEKNTFGYTWRRNLEDESLQFESNQIQNDFSLLLNRAGWINTIPESGTISKGEDKTIYLQVVTREMPKGDYQIDLRIESNDPNKSIVNIPLHIAVVDESLVAGNSESVPQDLTLFQNYPNPFNPQTTISFSIPEHTHTRLIVYNALGQAIRTLVDEQLPPGDYQINWHAINDFGQQLPSGIYFYELKAKEISLIKKMILLH